MHYRNRLGVNCGCQEEKCGCYFHWLSFVIFAPQEKSGGPIPKAFDVTFRPGAACWRFISLRYPAFCGLRPSPIRARSALRFPRGSAYPATTAESRPAALYGGPNGFLLIRTQVSRWRFLKYVFRKLAPAVPLVGRWRVRTHRFRNVADYREASAHHIAHIACHIQQQLALSCLVVRTIAPNLWKATSA